GVCATPETHPNISQEGCSRPAALRLPVPARRSRGSCSLRSPVWTVSGEVAARRTGALNWWLTFPLPAAYSSCSSGASEAPPRRNGNLRYLFEDYALNTD